MRASEFIKLLKQAHDVPNYYNNHFPYNCGYYDGKKYSWDCWNLIKTLLASPPWSDTRVKGSYVSPSTFVTGDVDGYHLLLQCTNRSKDFSQLHIPATYLYISNSPHAGIYVGDFKYQGEIFNVVECTGAWDSKVQYTYVDEKGGRYLYKNGPKNKYSWTDYGLLPYIEYDAEPVKPQIAGIDVSRWQGVIDWKAVKNDGYAFAILKAGGSDCGRYEDAYFKTNYDGAKAVGLKVGCYYFNGKGCTSASAGMADAQHFLTIIGGKTFEYPCFSDLEAPTSATKQGNTDAVIGFCETVKSAGYLTGVYASDISGFKDRLDISRLGAYDKWVARYGSMPKYVTDYVMWQYSSSGSVKGINGRVDMNISYKDYSPAPAPDTYYYMGVDFSPVFDPDYYANRYPDLEGAFGYDHSALWNHFITFGMNELRQASAEFDPRVYIDRYEDLRKAFGENYPLYYWHYCYFGKNEGRNAS